MAGSRRAGADQAVGHPRPALADPAAGVDASTTPTPPSEPTKVPDFVSRLDDRQARAVLLETLGQRAAAGKPEETDSLGDVFGAAARTARQATGRLATLGRSIGEAPDAMRLAFTYLGIAPAGLVPIAIILAAIVLGAAGVEGLVRLVSSRRSRARREARGGRVRLRLVLAARGLAVLAFAVAAGAGVGIAANIIEPSLLQVVAALAAGIVAVRFAQAFALTALDILMPEARGRGLRLHRRIAATHFAVLHVIVVFGLLFLTTLRHAQADYELRLLCGLLLWTIFCGVALGALARLLPLTAAHEPSREVSEGLVITWLRRHWFGIAVAATVLLWGMTSVAALATGIGELRTGVLTALVLTYAPVIIGFVTAALKRSVPKGDSRSPRALWAVALIRCARVGGALAAGALLARIWQIDPVGLASDRLGERVAGAFANVLVVVLLAYVAWEIVKAIVRGQLGDRDEGPVMPGEDGQQPASRVQTFLPLLEKFLLVVLLLIAALAGLRAMGVDTGPLLAGAGIVGIAIGFGAQTLVRDIVSGVFFLFDDAFRLGEYIEIDQTRGTVEGISIRSMRIRHHRGAVHTVPFGTIQRLTNYSRDWIILKLEFLLAFDTDLKKVKNIVKKIGEELLEDPEYGPLFLEPVKSQGVRRMEQIGIVVGIKFMAKPGEQFILRREVYQRVRDAFEANGIDFARPQVTVQMPGGRTAAVDPQAMDPKTWIPTP